MDGNIERSEPAPAMLKLIQIPYMRALSDKLVKSIITVKLKPTITVKRTGFISNISSKAAIPNFKTAASSEPIEPIMVNVESGKPLMNPIILYADWM